VGVPITEAISRDTSRMALKAVEADALHIHLRLVSVVLRLQWTALMWGCC
jgi:hypothetical protein